MDPSQICVIVIIQPNNVRNLNIVISCIKVQVWWFAFYLSGKFHSTTNAINGFHVFFVCVCVRLSIFLFLFLSPSVYSYTFACVIHYYCCHSNLLCFCRCLFQFCAISNKLCRFYSSIFFFCCSFSFSLYFIKLELPFAKVSMQTKEFLSTWLNAETSHVYVVC